MFFPRPLRRVWMAMGDFEQARCMKSSGGSGEEHDLRRRTSRIKCQLVSLLFDPGAISFLSQIPGPHNKGPNCTCLIGLLC